jgi:Zn finger protein HypA/HybF involved in hydrogenase expression
VHEAGIARTIADAIRDHGIDGVPVRVLVTGGHDVPADFDASLRFHLEVVAPGLDPDRLTIVHRPAPRWCPSCGTSSDGLPGGTCPGCGGPTLGSSSDESIELEWDAAASSGTAGPGRRAGVDGLVHDGAVPSSPSADPAARAATGDRERPHADGP